MSGAGGGTRRSWRLAVLVIAGVAALGAVGWLAFLWLRPEVYEGITVSGDTVSQRVDSAVAEIVKRHPHWDIEVEHLDDRSISMRVGWINPELRGSGKRAIDRYVRAVETRVKDYREATILLLKVLAQATPQLRRLSAFEDHVVVPVWSRDQILRLADPKDYRNFKAYSRVQLAAQTQEGLADPTQGTEAPVSRDEY